MSVLDLDLPTVEGSSPYAAPKQHLRKLGESRWTIEAGRRSSPTLLANAVRTVVDEWRASDYTGASSTTRALLEWWFDEERTSRSVRAFYFCQREAIETLIFLIEVNGFRDYTELLGSLLPAATYSVHGSPTDRSMRHRPSASKQEETLPIPDLDLARFAIKMATGSGKTAVMAMFVVWSYLHRTMEPGSTCSRHFLLVAPNLAVYDRLATAFAGGAIFTELDLVPPSLASRWSLVITLRDDPPRSLPSLRDHGTLIVTNFQQLLPRPRRREKGTNPISALLGEPAREDLFPDPPTMRDLLDQFDDLSVLNDEAHHLHDGRLAWATVLQEAHANLRGRNSIGLAAWLDFSATPKHPDGRYFSWIVSDYSLSQAVEDNVTKTPLILHQIEQDDPRGHSADEAPDAYGPWIALAIARWRIHCRDYGSLGVKPVLFVMAEDTLSANAIAARLAQEDDLRGRVLTIHTDPSGEIPRDHLSDLRQAAHDIDAGSSNYAAVVSVLMLREGWDVRSVTVVLGLRAFTAKSEILPEQAIGRGLRLLPQLPRAQPQILEIIGTRAFEQFVRGLETDGLLLTTTPIAPPPATQIFPQTATADRDIVLPRIQQRIRRQARDPSNLSPATIGPLWSDPSAAKRLSEVLRLEHGTLKVILQANQVGGGLETPTAEESLRSITNQIAKRARLTGSFGRLYPMIRDYVRTSCFGSPIDLHDQQIRTALGSDVTREEVVSRVAQQLSEITIEESESATLGASTRVSETRPFAWRGRTLTSKKSVLSAVACRTAHELEFAAFLDRAADVRRFARLSDRFTGFSINYLKDSGSLGLFYPDFVAVWTMEGEAQHGLFATNGVSTDPRFLAQILTWCDRVTNATNEEWHYHHVPETVVGTDGWSQHSTLSSLIDRLPRPSARHPQSPSLWRSLLRVTGMESQKIRFVIPSWDPHSEVEIERKRIPAEIQGILQIGLRVHAQVNIGAGRASDLVFHDWEPR